MTDLLFVLVVLVELLVGVAVLVGDCGGVACRRDGVDMWMVFLRSYVFYIGCQQLGTGHVTNSVGSDHMVRLSGNVADPTVRR